MPGRGLPRDGGTYWGTREEEGPQGDIYLVRKIGSA